MASYVKIWNITDESPTPHGVDIYNHHVEPGAFLDLPADLVDERIRGLETAKSIAIGGLPTWYEKVKTKKGSRQELSPDEVRAKFHKKAPTTTKAATVNGTEPPPVAPPPVLPISLGSDVQVQDDAGTRVSGSEDNDKRHRNRR